MNNRTLFALITAGVIGILSLFLFKATPHLPTPTSKELITLNNVRGSAVFKNKKPFTLNFDQQNSLIGYLNRAVQVKKSDYSNISSNFDKITIYQFKDSDVEIFPINSTERNLILNIPAWNSDFYFMDLSAGKLSQLIQSASE